MKKQSESVSNLERLFVETAGELAQSLSLNRVVGQIYALLYVSPDPVPLEAIAAKLGISKGSASVNVRVLEEWNAVKSVWTPSSRKDFYTAEPDFMKVVSERLEKGFLRRLSLLDAKLDLAQKELDALGRKAGAEERRKAEFYKERLAKIVELRALAEKLVKNMGRVRELLKSPLLKSLL